MPVSNSITASGGDRAHSGNDYRGDSSPHDKAMKTQDFFLLFQAAYLNAQCG
jgi:hypothetical protein